MVEAVFFGVSTGFFEGILACANVSIRRSMAFVVGMTEAASVDFFSSVCLADVGTTEGAEVSGSMEMSVHPSRDATSSPPPGLVVDGPISVF